MLMDFRHLAAQHRRALSDNALIILGIVLVLACPLIGLAIGVAFFGVGSRR